MLILGIDLGTTKSAAVLWNSETDAAEAFASQPNEAGYGTQSVGKILSSAVAAVRRLPEQLRQQAAGIGITGQMHGVLGWNRSERSELETWQSTLAAEHGDWDRIRRLPGCEKLASGYGFATLALPSWRRNFDHAATVMDYFAALLVGREDPVTDPTDAASWGLWDMARDDWDRDAVRRLGIPERMLPRIVPSGTVIGGLGEAWAERLGLSTAIPVRVPLGDNPAAIIGSGGTPESDLFLTVGTGAQLAFVTGRDLPPVGENLELRPFPGGRQLALTASLCGGKALDVLADFVGEVLAAFGVRATRSDIYRQLAEPSAAGAGGLAVSTAFAGERRDPARRGGISGIDTGNFHFRTLCRAWCEGILDGLLEDFPKEVLAARPRLVVNGNAIRRSPLFRQVIRERLPQIEVVLPASCEEAACGAAKYFLRYGC